jgi:hypothetical protein
MIWGGIILMISWRDLFDCNDGAIKLALHTGCWWKKSIFLVDTIFGSDENG